MKIKVNYTVTANKEADVSGCACEEEEELLPSYVSLSLSFYS
jgi:hypothetical protein